MSSPLLLLWSRPEVKRFVWLLCGWLVAASVTILLSLILVFSLKGESDVVLPNLFQWSRAESPVQSWPLNQGTTQFPLNSIEATSVILVNETSGEILASRLANHRLPIASTTKIMTAIVALEYGNLDSSIRVDGSWLSGLPADSTMMGISHGETYRLEELLYGLMLSSGNDAAMVIASAISPTEADFVDLMNAKATQFGLKDTHFANAVGLDDPGHYSTAHDLAVMAHMARQYPAFVEIVKAASKVLPYSDNHKELKLENLNTMVGTHPGVTGIKPGNTGQAGNCLVVSYTKDRVDYLAVLLDTPGRTTNMAKLLELIP